MANRQLLDDLRAAIAEYLDNHKNLSIQYSNRTQVSYSTIRRIVQNECKDVRDETILALIQIVMPPGSKDHVFKQILPFFGRSDFFIPLG